MRASAVRVASRDLDIPSLRKTRTRQSSAAMLRLFCFSLSSLARYSIAEQRKRSVSECCEGIAKNC
jgi:hypothetical protein